MNLNENFAKKADSLRIYINSTKNSRIDLNIIIEKGFDVRQKFYFSSLIENKEFFLVKKSFEFLEFPYESNCIYYDGPKTPFNSLSHEHCIRQCIRYHCQIKLNCSCTALDLKIYETDYGYNNMNFCRNFSELSNFRDNYKKLCTHLCPIDCIRNEYEGTVAKRNHYSALDKGSFGVTLDWDQSKPFLINKETPVMNFLNYFCYIGGLFGIWFGISANQLYLYLMEKRLLFYLYLMEICRTVSNRFIEFFFRVKRN